MRLDLFMTAIRVPLDFILLVLAGLTAWAVRFSESVVSVRPVQFALTFPAYVRILVPTAIIWLLIFAMNGLYTLGTNKKFSEELKTTIVACFASLALVTLAIFFRGEKFDSRFLVLAGAFFGLIYVLMGRLLLRLLKVILYKQNIGARKVIFIGDSPLIKTLVNAIEDNAGYGYVIVKHAKTLTNANRADLARIVRREGVEEIIFVQAGSDTTQADEVLAFCGENHLTLKFAPDLFAMYRQHTGIDTIAGIPIIELKRTRLEGWGRITKRLVDVVGSLVLLILASPILLLCACSILIESGRPVFYKNERVGEGGRTFNTLKFRSMYQKYSIGSQFKYTKDALKIEQELIEKQNSKAGPIYKIINDPRVTPFGRFIRRWSIDEIPQFINVLLGSMSLVGPRPHQPREVEKYQLAHKKVHTIRPGISGLAQISGRSDLPFEDESRLDIFYIENWSLLMDLAILLKTPWAVLRRRKVE